ncbi:hypothetical protein [Mycobacterium sp. DBP42]|uniref:hypothetical protein n=1 Tax=Mycobacterium sp. DBP42 TaxID=2545267 RepID=UPI00110CAB32|nr:hypothetical protein [Mycobacterium sp. DBP42]TMS55346.1 hypothetical protein E0T84_03385 [Mycobacterium sp. DBP42]
MSPLVWAFVAAAIVSMAGGVLLIAGWGRGELSGSLWGPVTAPLLLATGFGLVAYQEAKAVKPEREAPEPAGAVAEVHNPLGIVFWLSAALALVVVAVVASSVTRFVRRAIRAGGIDKLDTTGLAAIGMTVLTAMALLATVLAAVAMPVRIIRSYGRTHLWLSHEGIGYSPSAADDPGFRPWDSVTAVTHSSRDFRGVVYSHAWTIRTGNPGWQTTVVYPAGAVPRPRAIRQAIADLAPATVEVV